MNWIPVTKSLPDQSGSFLIFKNGEIDLADYMWLHCRFCDLSGQDPQPTHWMPLPPPPEQNK